MFFPTQFPWAKDQTLGEHLEASGVSRREFLEFCGQMAVLLGLTEMAAPRVAAALEGVKRPVVIWIQLQECTGCVESILRSGEPSIGELILNLVSLDYSHTLMAASGTAAEAALAASMKANMGEYLLVVTGSVPLAEDGIYTTMGGRTAKDVLVEVAAGAKAIFAVGACAHWGSVQAAKPNPTGAVGVGDVIKDKPIVHLTGCPPIAETITATLVHYLTFGGIPALDSDGRPLFAYGARIHDQCPRRANFDAGQYVEALRRRRRPPGLVPVQGGLQGAGDLQPLPDLPVEHEDQLADRRRASVHRLHRAQLLGYHDPVLQPPPERGRDRHRTGPPTRSARRSPPGRWPVWPRTPPPPPSTRSGRTARRRRSREVPMATTKVVVDPITRIEGHLRIEAQSEAGMIKTAWASSTQFRGIEIIMQGRDPRDAWAFTQRICGVCTVVHAVASCRAVEDALGITIPPNATLIRNLVHGMQTVQDHVIHFYHLHALDWVDVISALSADPAKTSAIAKSISPWPNNSSTYFAEVQNRIKTFAAGGQLGIFTNGYWGHPAYQLPPEVNLLAVAHYLEALDWQKDVIRLHTIFGGKNPHPNFLVGGMASAINLNDTATINAAKLADVQAMITRAKRFVDEVYWPDVQAIAGFYKNWGAIGGGTGNYLTVGEYAAVDSNDLGSLYFPRGIVMNRDLSKVYPVRPHPGEGGHHQLVVRVRRRRRRHAASVGRGDGPKYTGPPTPWTYLQGEKKYTWMKSPRYDGHADGGGPALPDAGGLRRGSARHQGDRHRAPQPARRAARGALLDPRPRRRPLHGDGAGGQPDAELVRPARRAASRAATSAPSTATSGSPTAGPRARCRATATSTPPAARSATGSRSRTARSRATSAWCPAPGTARRATRPACRARTRRR